MHTIFYIYIADHSTPMITAAVSIPRSHHHDATSYAASDAPRQCNCIYHESHHSIRPPHPTRHPHCDSSSSFYSSFATPVTSQYHPSIPNYFLLIIDSRLTLHSDSTSGSYHQCHLLSNARAYCYDYDILNPSPPPRWKSAQHHLAAPHRPTISRRYNPLPSAQEADTKSHSQV